MRRIWHSSLLFGAGLLFGVVGAGVLFAPAQMPEPPPPWNRLVRDDAAAAATHVAGAGPAAARPAASTPAPVVQAAAVPAAAPQPPEPTSTAPEAPASPLPMPSVDAPAADANDTVQ